MKKVILFFIIFMFLFQALSLPALANTKSDWINAQQKRINAEEEHKQAKKDYQADKTPENDQKVIDTAKDVFNAVLNEVAMWLHWKNNEAQSNPNAPQQIKDDINSDVRKTLANIKGFRQEVAGITTRLDVGVVFLKMIGAYTELLADVARNTGAMWVHIGNNMINRTENFEAKLRTAADKIDDNSEIINKLDQSKQELNTAQDQINQAEQSYKKVKIPGTPLIKFAEGNGLLRQAKLKLQNAQQNLWQAFNLIVK